MRKIASVSALLALSLVMIVVSALPASAKVNIYHDPRSEAAYLTTFSGWGCTGSKVNTYRGQTRYDADAIWVGGGWSLWIRDGIQGSWRKIAYRTTSGCVNVGREWYLVKGFAARRGQQWGAG